MSHRYRIAFRETLCGGVSKSRLRRGSTMDTNGSEYDSTRRRSSRASRYRNIDTTKLNPLITELNEVKFQI